MNKTRELSIKEEQEIQVTILRIFNRMCKNENICYWLAYGTLLGAVREHGFIEWDDDVDVWVRRTEFKKILESFYNYFDRSKYFLQCSDTDPNNYSPEMLRICVNGTYKWPQGCENEKFHTGIYFDIFPLDYGFGDKRDQEYLNKMTKYHTLIRNNLNCSKIHNGILRTLYHSLQRVIFTFDRCKRKILKISEVYEKNAKCETMITLPSSFAGSRRSLFRSDWFSEIVYMEFEDMMLPCPKKYKELLAYMYGEDYMIPSKTKPYVTKAYLINNCSD